VYSEKSKSKKAIESKFKYSSKLRELEEKLKKQV